VDFREKFKDILKSNQFLFKLNDLKEEIFSLITLEEIKILENKIYYHFLCENFKIELEFKEKSNDILGLSNTIKKHITLFEDKNNRDFTFYVFHHELFHSFYHSKHISSISEKEQNKILEQFEFEADYFSLNFYNLVYPEKLEIYLKIFCGNKNQHYFKNKLE
jgi:hypothetical protein